MEKFSLNFWSKGNQVMNCVWPIALLLGLLGSLVFVILPSQDSMVEFRFQWWVPLFAVALVIWAIIAIRKALPVFRFTVKISDQTICVGDEEAAWSEIVDVEFKNTLGEKNNIGEPIAIVLRTKSDKTLRIPATLASFAYVKGFIEGHTKHLRKPENG